MISAPVPSDSPRCQSAREVVELDGQEVLIQGVYEQMDVRLRAAGPPVHEGHASLVLEDTTTLLLEPVWHADAKRSADEIARFEGKAVIVRGVVHRVAPQGAGTHKNLVMPCITPVVSITLGT